MRSLIILTIIILFPLDLLAIPYWPEYMDGEVYYYEINGVPDYPIRYLRFGDFQIRKHDCDCLGHESYSLVDGVVGLVGFGSHWIMPLGPFEGEFHPPVPIAWIGMKDGDVLVWENESGLIIIEVFAEQIETPLGKLNVLRVQLTPFGVGFIPISRYYLHIDYGPVQENSRVLFGWDIPVAVENQSWSNVKAMYR